MNNMNIVANAFGALYLQYIQSRRCQNANICVQKIQARVSLIALADIIDTEHVVRKIKGNIISVRCEICDAVLP